MLNDKEWKIIQAIKERGDIGNCAGYSGLSIEEARWLISLLERHHAEAESPNEKWHCSAVTMKSQT
jgi:hypothetical protein